jgi:hypothetical protein
MHRIMVILTPIENESLQVFKSLPAKTCEGILIEFCHKGGQDAQDKKMTR